MKDLIERLRHGYPSKERLEAADAIHALTTENTRLTECLRISNNNHEAFERKWYLATDENAQLKAELAAMHSRSRTPVAYITETEQGPMVWTPEMYGEACTYCDDGEFPLPLVKP